VINKPLELAEQTFGGSRTQPQNEELIQAFSSATKMINRNL